MCEWGIREIMRDNMLYRMLLSSLLTSAMSLRCLIGLLVVTSPTMIKSQQPGTTNIPHEEEEMSSTSPNRIWRFPLERISGTLHVNVWLGHPPVAQTWIVDTGSRFTATTCDRICPHCAGNDHAHAPFPGTTTHQLVECGHCQMAQQCTPLVLPRDQEDMLLPNNRHTAAALHHHEAVLTSSNLHCQFRQRYTEGSSWTAWEINEIVAVHGVEFLSESNNSGLANDENDSPISSNRDIAWDMSVPLAMGCQTEIKGLFREQFADGILGLEKSDYNLVSVMHQQGLIPRAAFRLCVHPQGAWMLMGHGNNDTAVTLSRQIEQSTPAVGTNRSTIYQTAQSKLRYSPSPHPKWYNVLVEEVWMEETQLVGPNRNAHVLHAFAQGKRTILDSGTTDSFLPVALNPIWSVAWQDQTGIDYRKRAYSYTYKEFLRLPTVTMIFQGNVTMVLHPKYYMDGVPLDTQNGDSVLVWPNKLHLYNRLYTDEPKGAVLGLNAMMGYEIEFDTNRVGIAPADCL